MMGFDAFPESDLEERLDRLERGPSSLFGAFCAGCGFAAACSCVVGTFLVADARKRIVALEETLQRIQQVQSSEGNK